MTTKEEWFPMIGNAFDECVELFIEDSRSNALGNAVRGDDEFEDEALGHGLPRGLGTLYADSASWQWAWTYPLTLEAVLRAHADSWGSVRGLLPRWFGRRYFLRDAGAVLTACTDRNEPCTEWEVGVVDAQRPGSAAMVVNLRDSIASGRRPAEQASETGQVGRAAKPRGAVQIDEAIAAAPDGAPRGENELLAMTAGEVLWLFASGYAGGPIAIHDPLKNQMRVVSEASEVERDRWETEYRVWMPTQNGRDFARKALRRFGMYNGPGAEQ